MFLYASFRGRVHFFLWSFYWSSINEAFNRKRIKERDAPVSQLLNSANTVPSNVAIRAWLHDREDSQYEGLV